VLAWSALLPSSLALGQVWHQKSDSPENDSPFGFSVVSFATGEDFSCFGFSSTAAD